MRVESQPFSMIVSWLMEMTYTPGDVVLSQIPN